ncbi:MAG TPA: nuclear transport factor 2 family protein [Gemmatimonadaceae bacterium]|nr:nuclear transport factor 2 family protein [Gemmatimonadaceae bacterium]
MKASILFLCFLVATATSPASAQQAAAPSSAAPTRAEQEVIDLSREKWRWMSERKVDTLAALFLDQAMFVHMSGSMSRSQELETIRSNRIHYKHAEIFESSARIIDSTAIVLTRIRLDAVVGGMEVTNPFMVTEVYVRQKGAWKLGQLSFSRLRDQ